MKIKTVLKGIGRLMLTTALMCGVGLFLCSSEVKATVGVTLDENNGDFKVTVSGDSGEVITSIDNVKLYDATDAAEPIFKVDSITASVRDDDSCTYIISKEDFLKGVSKSAIIKGNSINIKKVDVSYKEATAGTGAISDNTITKTSAPIYEVIMAYNKIDTTASFDISSFSYKNTTIGADIPYGYEGNNIEVTATPTSSYVLGNYYRYYYNGASAPTGSAEAWRWAEANTKMTIKVDGTAGNNSKNEYSVTYLPKINELEIKEPSTGIVDVKVGSATSKYPSTTPNVKYSVGSWQQSGESCKKNVIAYIYNYQETEIDNNTLYSLNTSDGADNDSFNVNMELMTAGEKGSGKVILRAMLPGIDGTKFSAAEKIVPVYLSVPAGGFELKNVPITVISGETKTVEIIKGILPASANQTLSNYSDTVTVTTGIDLLKNIPSYDKTKGTVTLEAKQGVTGTATVKIELEDIATSTSLGTEEFSVNIVSFDKDKTIDSINKSNKNYITYNKDKGYSLDIKQLIIDNAKNSNGDSITLTKDQITNVTVGGSSCDGTWKPSEAALNKKVSFTLNGSTTIDSDKFKVSAYPMPTATYSSSNRTLTVKIPTKVSTAYSDDNNIRQSKGFKLLLVDSSGNTLYEYTDSKYQSVLSSSSESTVSYTVTASDIEGMITSAASNGKFSADTTSVKFKVIPMGYKQSSSSDETIKAKDEIAGTTDAVTVYKVSASGTNFTTAAAYGLDGQTVSLTATPNSGYTFKQWSDGNTSNPRQIKVSASGTRSFQAVAGERVANSTGAGGTDNSALYDDVPKTSESNSAIWLIVFMVFAVMGTTYALYLQLRAANSKHDR